MKKGSKVLIEGKLKTNSWEKNGQKFSKIFCLADKVHFLASEEQSGDKSKPQKPTQQTKKVEKVEEDLDDIEYEDIPFNKYAKINL